MKWTDVLGLALIVFAVGSWLAGDGGVLPEPAPEPGARTVVVVEETESDRMDPAYAQLVKSPTLRAYIDDHGHDWELIDTDDQSAASRWVDDLQSVETPWLVIADGERRLYEGPVPLPERAFIETLQSHGG